jgi:hypothetical protein
MVTVSLLTRLDDIKILLTHESASYLSNISEVNLIMLCLFLVLYLVLLIFFWKKLSVTVILILCSILLLWLLSGRTIAFKYFPNGRILTGWYYIESNQFTLCGDDEDYERIISQETKLIESPYWSVRVVNENIDETIFIGPFTWRSSMEVLRQIGKDTN